MPAPDPRPRPGEPGDVSPLLFAYGTLLPGEPRWGFLQPFVVDEGVVAAVLGWLYDTGRGYPAARFAWDPGDSAAPQIHGRVFALAPDRVAEAWRVLDEVEGAVAGLYRRVVVELVGGGRAAAYEYGAGLDLRPIPTGRWIDVGD